MRRKKTTPAEVVAAYPIPSAINQLITSGAISGAALKLWLQLKMLAWKDGECDPTDAELRALLNGMARETIRLARTELRNLHLLVEYRGADAAVSGPHSVGRWLIPLPAPAALPAHVPMLARAEVVSAREAFAREALAREALAREALAMGAAAADAPPAPMSAAPVTPVEEPRVDATSAPDAPAEEPRVDAMSAPVTPAEEPHVDATSAPDAPPAPMSAAPVTPVVDENRAENAPPAPAAPENAQFSGQFPLIKELKKKEVIKDEFEPEDLEPFRFGPQPGTLEFERTELALFLEHHGMYPIVADKCAATYLRRMDRLQAMIWTLALRREADLHLLHHLYVGRDMATSAWVTRVRRLTRPAAWALEQAAAELLYGATARLAAASRATTEEALRGPSEKGPSEKGPLEKGSLERGSLERGSLERGSLGRGSLGSGDVPERVGPPTAGAGDDAGVVEDADDAAAGPLLPLRGVPSPLTAVWDEALELYRLRMVRAMFNDRLRATTPVGVTDDGRVLVVATVTRFDAEFLNCRLVRLTRGVAADVMGEGYAIRFEPRD